MISFVGAGPGAPDLITLRGLSRLEQAEVVIWASSLVPEAVLSHCRPSVITHDSATMTLEDVLKVYETAGPETAIVRLHSGDPSVYGAIQEQIDWCIKACREFEIVPGVTSVSAAAGIIGRELTIPGVAQSVVFTRLAGRTSASMPERESVAAFAAMGTTMAVFLSAARPKELQDELLADGSGYSEETPAVIVIRASWPDQQVIRTTVGNLCDRLKATGIKLTVLVLVGPALADSKDSEPVQRSHLYAPDYAHHFRKRSVPGTTTGRPA